MERESWIAKATKTAQAVVLVTFAATGLLVVALAAERTISLHAARVAISAWDPGREAELATLERHSWYRMGGMVSVAGLAYLLLWRRLVQHLARSEAAFRKKQGELEHLALHDGLTGLANRRQLALQLQGAVARAERDDDRFAVLVLDVDGFKPINDRFGHEAGDAVLKEIGQRLGAHVRKDEIAARLGADEFVVLLNHIKDVDVPMRAAQRLTTALNLPIPVPGGEVQVGTSAGVAVFPHDGVDPEELLRKADMAMSRAKGEGGNKLRFFQEAMDIDARRNATLALDMRQALDAGHIVPHFQPLVDLATGALTGFEVLARWHHPKNGFISPAVFIPVAEKTGQIDTLMEQLMRASLLIARDWNPALRIAFNISPLQLKREDLAAQVLHILEATAFPPSRFEVEITESALIDDLALARRTVGDLKSHGVHIALDDFGTGYSSLTHLSELPFDKIKIDRSFVHNMARPESTAIISAIIGLGNNLNLTTTAEGIESQSDADRLLELGCRSGQGFLYSKPVPAREAELLLARDADRLSARLLARA